jgi:pilus assembly protein Flp/PilA
MESSTMTSLVRRFIREEEGASLAEYALLLGVITVALIGIITAFRQSIANIFNRTTNTLNSAGTT